MRLNYTTLTKHPFAGFRKSENDWTSKFDSHVCARVALNFNSHRLCGRFLQSRKYSNPSQYIDCLHAARAARKAVKLLTEQSEISPELKAWHSLHVNTGLTAN